MFKIDRHEVPIAIRALKTANVYEIRGKKKIIVDSGMSEDSYRALMEQGLSMDSVDYIFLTHLHIDHIGNAHRMQQEYGISVAMGEEDIKRVKLHQGEPGGLQGFPSGNNEDEWNAPGNN
ncbi:MAG: Zn-dependent hydrolase [Thermoplasmatales archaeon A-plasma]|nr:MAG: Zn-dependent hydrolase [Thermoplasmatales archaeon A-plasma]